MVLNYIWIAFFLIAFVVAIGKLVIGGDTAVFTEIINASFASAKTGFEISLGLTGILSLWLGERRDRKSTRLNSSHPGDWSSDVCSSDLSLLLQLLFVKFL